MTPDLDRPPSFARWAVEFPRAVGGIASLVPARGMLAAAPRGDGRPVMVLPGLVNSDIATALMRRYLQRLGYRVEGWGLGRNLGARTIGGEGERLLARIAVRAEAAGEPVTLIGLSLGGIMARFAAHRLPEAVREVITIASPYAGDPRATRVWRVYERLSGESIDDPANIALREEVARPLPVPATAIWSRTDGLVNGFICHRSDEPGCRAIEVESGHLAVQMRPQVLRAVADVLAGEGR